ncbi:MAG: LysM peptidoglycan-binding domain-containing protein [Chloroflexi bacterium]|nr:LysM peptidoglycan-binding domain-containing protein [Chloroflexota bacterium]
MRRLFLCLTCALLLAACAGETTPDLAPAAPYQTASPSLTPTLIPALTEILLPTPTVVIYTVALGDTLGAIADRFGVSLEALMAANPDIQPTALTVGTQLVIPTDSAQPSEPTPSPAPVPVRQAHCWPETSGGLWCFSLIQNEYAEMLENLSAQFTLLDENGDELASQIAYAPLNILPPGASMPLGVHFPAPVDAQSALRVQVLTAIRLLPGDARYLPVMLENTLVSVGAGGHSAQVSGRVMLTTLDGLANTLWVLAVAYDEAGSLVGFRRWEAGAPLAGGESVVFDFLVSSMGPEISRVEFLTEARP